MPSLITRFKCDHCKRHYSTKQNAIRHEKGCLYNPANKSCSTCGNRTADWCDLNLMPVFVHGLPIRNCMDWTEISFADGDLIELEDW